MKRPPVSPFQRPEPIEVASQRRKRPASSFAEAFDERHQAPDPNDRRIEIERRSRWLTMRDAADYLGFKTAEGARQFLRHHGVRLHSRGRSVVVRVGAIDDVIETGKSDLVERARRAMGK